MGTSKSYGGPTDAVNRLLPTWAVPNAGAPEGGAGNVAAGSGAPVGIPAETSPAAPDVADAGTAPQHHPWQTARRSLGAASRGLAGSRNYRRAVRDYVHASGGARKAAQRATGGRQATARLGGFLVAIASGGLANVSKYLGLGSLVGKSINAIFVEIANTLAPVGASMEESAARMAIADTLAMLYELHGVDIGGLARLEAMTPDDIRGAVVETVSTYVFYRWAQELGLSIERGAISPKEAVAIEREMRHYIRETVKLDLSAMDVLALEWSGSEGRRVIEGVFAQAYAFLEVAL
jgi:hypothetical protein